MSSDTEIKAEEGEENVSDRVGKLILPSDDDITFPITVSVKFISVSSSDFRKISRK